MVAVVGFGLGLILVVCFCVVYVMHACVQFRILLVLLSRALLPGGFDCECACVLCAVPADAVVWGFGVFAGVWLLVPGYLWV